MSHDELQAAHQQLKAEATRLREERDRLESENVDLRRKLGESEQRLAEAETPIAELKRELFGPKSDRLTPEQQEQLSRLNQDLEAESQSPAAVSDGILEADQEEKKNKQTRATRRRRVRHPLPAHLETETITIEPEVLPCPCCGKIPEQIGEEVSEEIDFVPAKLIRRRTMRPKYACRCGEAGVAIAPLPPRLIPQSRLGLGLVVHVVLARYDDHLSFYRLEQQFRERHGIVIPRPQMVQWAEHIATWLVPVYDAMWKDMLAGGYLQVDETPVKVLDPEVQGKAARGYLWFYAVPGGDVILVFDPSRGQQPVRDRLKDFAGTNQTDAYDVYEALRKRQPGLQRIGCLAHSRRCFYAAARDNLTDAVWFITQIRRLYQIEDEIRDLPPDERYRIRQERAPATWQALKARAEELKPRYLPQSTLGNAVRYFTNEYEALIGYLRDERFEIDNNAAYAARGISCIGFYLDSGWPGDNYEVTVGMAMALVSRGWEYGRNLLHLCFTMADHSATSWGFRLHLPLQFLNGAVARACRVNRPVLGERPFDHAPASQDKV